MQPSLPAAAPSAHMGNCLIRLREDPHVPAHLVIDYKVCDLFIDGQVITLVGLGSLEP